MNENPKLQTAIKKWLEENYNQLTDNDIGALIEFCENKLLKIQDSIERIKEKYGEYDANRTSIQKRFAEIKNMEPDKVAKWQEVLSDELNRIKSLASDDRTTGFGGEEEFFTWYLEQEKKCHYCGIAEAETKRLPKEIVSVRNRGKYLEIEKKDPNGRYNENNCALACYFCNNDKSNVFNAGEYKKFFQNRVNYLKNLINPEAK